MLATLLTSPEVLTLLGWLCATALIGLVAGCDCCNVCAIASDDFSGTLGDWTVDSGTFTISGASLSCTAAGYIIHNTTPSERPIVVQFTFNQATSAKYCGAVLAWSDSNNHYWVRYTAGSNTITIGKTVSGTPTTLATRSSVTINTSTTYTAKICINAGGDITAYLDGNPKLSALNSGIGADNVGISCESNSAVFDDFALNKSSEATDASSCEACRIVITGSGCDLTCCNYLYASEYDITIPSVFSDALCSGLAAQFNGVTFTLPNVSSISWQLDLGVVGSVSCAYDSDTANVVAFLRYQPCYQYCTICDVNHACGSLVTLDFSTEVSTPGSWHVGHAWWETIQWYNEPPDATARSTGLNCDAINETLDTQNLTRNIYPSAPHTTTPLITVSGSGSATAVAHADAGLWTVHSLMPTDQKRIDPTNRVAGTVIHLRLDRGFAFLQVDGEDRNIFAFYRDFGPDIPFDATLEQRRVEFTIIDTPRGPRAKAIEPEALR